MVTSLLPGNLGNVSLGILYASICVFVFVAPPVVRALGDKNAMLLGAACYVVYLASLIHIVRAAVLVASVVIGFGATVLWVAMGTFLTKCSAPHHVGRNTGIFWGIFQLSNVLGNLLVYFLYAHARNVLFIVFTAVAAGGVGILFLLRPLRPGPWDNAAPGLPAKILSPGNFVLATFRFLANPAMLLCAPLFFFSGFEMGFWAGEFPQLLAASAVGLVLTGVGVGEVAGGALYGWLSDRAGRFCALALGAALYGTGLGLSAWLQHTGPPPGPGPALGGASVAAYAAALCFGLVRGSLCTRSCSGFPFLAYSWFFFFLVGSGGLFLNRVTLRSIRSLLPSCRISSEKNRAIRWRLRSLICFRTRARRVPFTFRWRSRCTASLARFHWCEL
jgi:MFS family permease